MKNIITSIIGTIVSLLIGVYIPKLFLEAYGASIHGCISTANNLSSYVLFFTSGLTTAAVQALYAPIGRKDSRGIARVYNAIDQSYRNISIYILLGFVALSIIMPFVVGDEVNALIVSSIYIILGIQYLIDNLWLRKYTALLRADDKLFIVNNISTISYFIQAIIQILILNFGLSVLIFQSVPIFIVIVKYIYLHKFVISNYSIDKNVEGDISSLNKKWNALIHQISGLILYNTDTVFLSIACSQVTVSIYAIYNLVFTYLFSFLSQVCSTALVAKFGNIYCTANLNDLQHIHTRYEYYFRIIITAIYSTTALFLLPFIALYTKNVEGVVYQNYTFGGLFLLANILNCIRIPALTIIDAAGHYKETQNHAIIEASINIILSSLLVYSFGIIGVLLGTITSFLYRSFIMIIYEYSKILFVKYWFALLKYIVVIFYILLLYLFCGKLFLYIETWGIWLLYSSLLFVVSLITSIFLNSLIDKDCALNEYRIIMGKLRIIYENHFTD